MNTESKPSEYRRGFLFGIRTGEKNKTYTLSVDACSSSEAVSELKSALIAIENGVSVFSVGEKNTMMIGSVAARSLYKSRKPSFIPVSAAQPEQEVE